MRDSEDSTEPALAHEPIDAIDAAEPMLPIEAKEPTLPIDRNDPVEPMDRNELRDHSESREFEDAEGMRHPPARYAAVEALLIRDAEVEGARVDVRLADGRITAVGHGLPRAPGEPVLDAHGGALLPGLHDHHLHLLAMAAAARSVPLGPPDVRTSAAFFATLAAATPDPSGWIRGVGYHDSVAGPLDRDVLDRAVPDRPVRVQHRGGALWVLNSAALAAAGLDDETDPDVERDASGRLTGRLFRWDARLGARLPSADPTAELREVGLRLAAFGITGVTDATPDLDAAAMTMLDSAALPQRIMLLGAPLKGQLSARFTAGPYKILLRDHDLPGTQELSSRIRAAHAAGRPVAVHCVTRESLLLTLAGLEIAGVQAGDRIEHAALVPPELRGELARRGLRVVTQPAFIAGRGDTYLAEVDPADHGCLYPYASLLAARVPVAPSSDAPFGEIDPWQVISAAVQRRTATGRVIAGDERVTAAAALAGYLSPAETPGGAPRRVRLGGVAELCLLHLPLEAALGNPHAGNVRKVFTSATHALHSGP